MAKKQHVSETPATHLLRAEGIAFDEYSYEWEPHGGARHSAEVLGLDPFSVVKTLVMQNQDRQPLIVLMHGNRSVSTKQLARQIGVKQVEPCAVEVAQRHSGYLVGGTSPFGTRKRMPVYLERSILELPLAYVNGGSRGFLVGIAPGELCRVLEPTVVDVALEA